MADTEITNEEIKKMLESVVGKDVDKSVSSGVVNGDTFDPEKYLKLNRKTIIGKQGDRQLTIDDVFGDRMTGDDIYLKADQKGSIFEFTAEAAREVTPATKTTTKLTINTSMDDTDYLTYKCLDIIKIMLPVWHWLIIKLKEWQIELQKSVVQICGASIYHRWN